MISLALDFQKEGNSVTPLSEIVLDASKLKEKRKELDTLRLYNRRDWALNSEFYKGNQWVFWNRVANQIESLGVDDGDRPRYKVRLTADQIKPGVAALVAQMTKTRPTIRAVPDSPADRDVKAAQMAERLYEFWWEELALQSKLQSVLTHAQISQGYWFISWDALAGKSMKVMVDPTGRPIADGALSDIFRDELEQAAQSAGMDPAALIGQFERTIYMGDIDVRVLDGQSVWLDPLPQNYEESAYVIVRYPMAVEDIKARFKKDVSPDTSVGESQPAIMYTRGVSGVDNRPPKNARMVYRGYFQPSPSMPKGRYVIWVEGPDMILEQGDWPFPFEELPVVKFPGIERPDSVYDDPRLTLVRPFQKELNNLVSKIAMHKNLTLKPQMLAPIGSLRQRLTDEPGAVFEFSPINGAVPQWRDMPNIPAYVFTYLEYIQNEIRSRFNLIPTERSQLPARTDSGQVVELMQEAVADQLSPEIKRMETALARVGKLMAALAQEYYTETRMLRIKGPQGAIQVKRFKNADIQGGFSFVAEAGSGLPRTRAGQIEQIKEMVSMGVIPPEEAIAYIPIDGLRVLQERMASDEDFANRRIQLLIEGRPINPTAVEQALVQIEQTGVNPETGMAFMSPMEAQQYVQQVALQPLPFENLPVTLRVLADYMKSVEFENYPPDVQQRFMQHFLLARQTFFELPNNADVKVTLGLHGTVGPTVASQILRDKGIIGATPDTMAEPPLDTEVKAYLGEGTKGTGGGSGNTHIDAAQQMMEMQQSASDHAMNTAKTAADISLAQQRQAHADQLHGQKLRHQEQAHQAKLQQMRQSRPTPTQSG